jgi:hypothetical protein
MPAEQRPAHFVQNPAETIRGRTESSCDGAFARRSIYVLTNVRTTTNGDEVTQEAMDPK